MGLEFVSGNAAPVSTDDMVAHLRLGGLDAAEVQTALIVAYVASATDQIQAATAQQLTTAVWRLKLDAFPCGESIRIPLPPLASVASITYLDAAGSTQTLSSTAYTVDTASKPGRVVLNDGYSWPDTKANANAVTVEFTAGYGAASAVPEMLKTAVRMLAAHLYENREAVVTGTTATEIPLAVKSIIDLNSFVEA